MNKTICPCNNSPICEEGKILVPIIIIEGQTLFDGTDLSDMKFTIKDEFEYYEHKCIVGTKCGIFSICPDKLKETIFQKCCKDISLVNVLRGEGKTAFDKAKFLYYNDPQIQTQVDFYSFYYNNLILYAMSKYILSRLLYGKFNIKFLLQKYNEEFFINLGNSRFCGALSIFNDEKQLATYNRFFK